ncbi:MAG: PaeR7I family type II restriction endonuclease [Coriobacteriia bacterium]
MPVPDYKEAVAMCWTVRQRAEREARQRGSKDPGLRAGVTSGKHLDSLADLVEWVLVDAGLPEHAVHRGSAVELPGYFRPEKRWDVVAVHENALVAAVEFKSILGSYGNNMNNRAEEALGNAEDLRQAAEAGLLGSVRPWTGYVFVMQDEDASRSPVGAKQPHFSIDPVFVDSSYQDRAIAMCRRLMLKGLYDAAWFVTGDGTGKPDAIQEPAPDLTWAKFETALRGRVATLLA